MAGSAVVAVRKALIEGLAAVVAVDNPRVSVTYGWQGSDDTASREQIFTNNARASHEPAALKTGRNFRDEQMDFDIVVLVLGVGQRPEESDQRAADLALLVEEFIADRKSNELGVAGLNWITVTDYALNYLIAPEGGSISEATITVRYRARLT